MDRNADLLLTDEYRVEILNFMCDFKNMINSTDFYRECCYLSSNVPVALISHGEWMSFDAEGNPGYAYGPPT